MLKTIFNKFLPTRDARWQKDLEETRARCAAALQRVNALEKRVHDVIYNKSPDQGILEFVRTRAVHVPERGTSLSAGYDFFLPDDFGVTDENNEPTPLVVKAGQSVLVPTGIHVKFPKEYVLIGFNKSGVAAKKSLLIGAQVIDADYQGEMHINLHNVGDSDQVFLPGQKLTQFIMLNVGLLPLFESDSVEALYGEETTDRGTGGFSSTGL